MSLRLRHSSPSLRGAATDPGNKPLRTSPWHCTLSEWCERPRSLLHRSLSHNRSNCTQRLPQMCLQNQRRSRIGLIALESDRHPPCSVCSSRYLCKPNKRHQSSQAHSLSWSGRRLSLISNRHTPTQRTYQRCRSSAKGFWRQLLSTALKLRVGGSFTIFK